jgi:hypothetical protein
LGKGRPIQNRAGNRLFQAIVDEHLSPYHSATNNKDKAALTTEVVRRVKEASGRFLSRESGVWIEVSDDIARGKVSHLFRNRKHLIARDLSTGHSANNRKKIRAPREASATSEDAVLNKRVKV